VDLIARRGIDWVLENRDVYRAHVARGVRRLPDEPAEDHADRVRAWHARHERLRLKLAGWVEELHDERLYEMAVFLGEFSPLASGQVLQLVH
jgi:hypothetical protein